MSLNDAAAAAVTKKVTLLEQSFSRFAVRSTLAGVYPVSYTHLTLPTSDLV